MSIQPSKKQKTFNLSTSQHGRPALDPSHYIGKVYGTRTVKSVSVDHGRSVAFLVCSCGKERKAQPSQLNQMTPCTCTRAKAPEPKSKKHPKTPKTETIAKPSKVTKAPRGDVARANGLKAGRKTSEEREEHARLAAQRTQEALNPIIYFCSPDNRKLLDLIISEAKAGKINGDGYPNWFTSFAIAHKIKGPQLLDLVRIAETQIPIRADGWWLKLEDLFS